MWKYQVTKYANDALVIHAHRGTVEIRTTGRALDEVWAFANAIERAVDERIVPLMMGETGEAAPVN